MKKVLILCLFISSMVSAQEMYTTSGIIKDKTNGETVFGASVYLKGTTLGVTTNEYGFYSITAKKGTYTLVVSYIGFNEENKEISLDKNQKINFEISENSTSLDEVVIVSEESERLNLKRPQMSVAKVNIRTIKKMPVVLGEVDVIKSIQMLPGVTNNGEGSSGFNVRGGAADQNLVLLDEAIIYNTSHLLGFFSVFNADAIKDIKLYKGGIPAKFGGRVSSVLDVRQKDGNSKGLKLSGGVGIIASRFTAEGPAYGKKGSFLVALRNSTKFKAEDNSAQFYDLNLKTNYELNAKNKLYLSGYFGRDVFDIGGLFSNSYGNLSGNLRWNHIFNDRLFSNLSMIYSKYNYELSIDMFEFDWVSSIKNYNAKYDFKYYLSDALKLDFGVNGIYYDFDPGEISPNTETSPVNHLRLEQKSAIESGLYINAEHKLTEKLTANYGLRYSQFVRLGGQKLANYENGLPVVYNTTLGIYEEGNLLSETYYSKTDEIKTYGNLEPRVSLAYQLTNSSSIKTGYSRTAQYIHLLSNTSSVTPLDVWAPSGKFIKPQLSDQYAIGYFKNFNEEKYSLEVETYYKTIDNRIDYIDGSDLIGNDYVETEILNGEGRAYGVEFLLKKNKGNFTGWIAYTLSKSQQRTPGSAAGGLGINKGNWYNSVHDRTHDISITGSYKANEKWSFGSNLVFQTGRPVTYPNGEYKYEDISIASYSLRNEDRLPSYHRLDVSATYTPSKNNDRKWKGEWVFGIYNLYARKNAASIAFKQNRETGDNEAIRTSIFGILPSVSYNFKF